jgi:hypothetical protein
MRFPLEDIQVASPCSAPWTQMAGNDQVRFCPQCRRQVFNLSTMTAEQAAELLRDKEESLCVRFHRRHDGTVVTRDGVLGLAELVRRPWV